MKKIFYIILPIAFLAYGAQANDIAEDPKKTAQDVGIIRCTVTIYKDRTEHDQDTWEEIVKRTVRCINIGKNENDGGLMMGSLVDLMTHIADNVEGKKGIHGEITLGMSDGKKSRCCGEVCVCPDRYAGNCPCEIVGENLCSKANKQESCCAAVEEVKNKDTKKPCCQKKE